MLYRSQSFLTDIFDGPTASFAWTTIEDSIVGQGSLVVIPEWAEIGFVSEMNCKQFQTAESRFVVRPRGQSGKDVLTATRHH